jgi:hypothetical protein
VPIQLDDVVFSSIMFLFVFYCKIKKKIDFNMYKFAKMFRLEKPSNSKIIRISKLFIVKSITILKKNPDLLKKY